MGANAAGAYLTWSDELYKQTSLARFVIYVVSITDRMRILDLLIYF